MGRAIGCVGSERLRSFVLRPSRTWIFEADPTSAPTRLGQESSHKEFLPWNRAAMGFRPRSLPALPAPVISPGRSRRGLRSTRNAGVLASESVLELCGPVEDEDGAAFCHSTGMEWFCSCPHGLELPVYACCAGFRTPVKAISASCRLRCSLSLCSTRHSPFDKL